jgi:ribosomal protein S12 methylthiotransferase
MVGALVGAGHEMVAEGESADVVVINTCGFITSAKQESIDAIFEAVRLKSGGCRSVIVAGCLAQRYADELRVEMPEVDAFVGVGRNAELPRIVEETLRGKNLVDCREPKASWGENVQRVRSTPPWTAYLRVADGCDNRCSYCAIPDIRGSFSSRPPDLVIDEAQRMAAEGVLEVNLVAQDVTRYGEDIPGWSLERLAGEIAKIESLRWIRLMYCYPTRITQGLIDLVAREPKIVKYLDIPFQHGEDRVLAAMNRRGSSAEYIELVRRIKAACPEIALRTSIIVGFPGETDEEFEALLGFVREVDFDRVGAFKYSREDGTPAADLKPLVSKKTANARYKRLMELAQEISLRKNARMVGREIEVLVEGEGFGRSYRDAPEIDGIVKLIGDAEPGEMVRAEVVDSDVYDITARVLGARG